MDIVANTTEDANHTYYNYELHKTEISRIILVDKNGFELNQGQSVK